MKSDSTNPYVGLRPYEVDESLLFFGRNDQTLELLQRLHLHHFVAVVGGSGCGKSSLLRAGLIPALKAGYLVDDSDSWFIAIMKPGQNPLYNLAESILLQINPQADSASVATLVQKIEEEGAEVILNQLTPLRTEKNINFFLLVDQFEELFRFAMEQNDVARKDEAIDFVNIMLELSQQDVFPFYVVITMRSDFIGDCAQFYGLPEAMNKSQYLVPRLNRVQLKSVIEGPAKLYGGRLDPTLTSRLLNELGKVKDELPLLQHALMRIWDFEEKVNKSGALDMEDYSKIGGIEKALSNHADEALSIMTNEELEIAKQLFKALTAIDESGRKIRRPVLFSQLNDLTDGTEEQLRHIIDMFIKDKRSFLIINKTGDTGDEIIDISHESLIRQWDTLSKWVDEEGESASNYLQLVEASILHKKKKKDYLSGSELQLALEWRDKYKPNAVWANRYKEGFEECMAYLNASEVERTRLNNIELRRKQIKRYLILSIMGILLFSAIGGLILYGDAKKSQKTAIEALNKSEKLINAFYFYDDKFALAFNIDKDFHFIDKNGNKIDKLGEWKKAEQFDDNGYAKVKDMSQSDFFLDTTGASYKAIYNSWEIDSSVKAIDLSSEKYSYEQQLPKELFSVKSLRILYLSYSQLNELPIEIGELKDLVTLDLYSNNLTGLPKEIGELNKLTSLGLGSNQLNSLPQEIGKLNSLANLSLNNNNLTSLPNEIGELGNLSTLDLSSNQLITLPKEIWELKKLTGLGLSGNQLVSLPKEIGDLENLNVLLLDSNQLAGLPKEVWELKNLTTLYLSGNQLTSMPAEMKELKNLTILTLGSNQLTSLPKEIRELNKLKTLYLDSNLMAKLPEELLELKDLTTLNLSNNQITYLPKEIGHLKNLTWLGLANNNLNSLPKEIGELKNLSTLYLSGNQLNSFAIDTRELKDLTWLGLANNQLASLPKEINELKNLTTLSLFNNKLTSIPNEIGELRNLTSIDLRVNQLTNLPNEIGNLENLNYLYLSNNQLTNLPKEIGELKNLTHLLLDNNQLTSLPKEIEELINITWFNLDSNQLTSLPKEIGKLTNLTWLGLAGNKLTSLPIETLELKYLSTMDLSNNKMTSLPKEIWDMEYLYSLAFKNNQMTSLPKEIGELINISSLDFSGNKLTSLPKEIGKLTYLYSLDLSNNQLTGIPKEISELQYLYSLNLSNNHLTSLPKEIREMQYLYILNLTGNNIPKEEIKKIRKQLPNCEIITGE